MEFGPVGRHGTKVTADVVQMGVGVPVVRKLGPDPARLRHQRMEDWIVVVTADKRLSVLEVDD